MPIFNLQDFCGIYPIDNVPENNSLLKNLALKRGDSPVQAEFYFFARYPRKPRGMRSRDSENERRLKQ